MTNRPSPSPGPGQYPGRGMHFEQGGDVGGVKVSFSKLRAFEVCPRLYWFQSVLKLPGEPSKSLELGTVVHEVVARWLQEGAKADPERLAEELVTANPLLTIEEDLPAVIQMLDGCRKFFVPLSPYAERRVEEWVEAEIGQGLVLTGRVDLIESDGEKVRITDWKTGFKTFGTDDTQQLDLYAWAVSRQYGGQPTEVRLWFLRYGPRKGIVMRESTPEHQQQAVEWAAGVAEQIRQASELPWQAGFPARPGNHCKTCPYAVQCLMIRAQELAVDPNAGGLDLFRDVLAGVLPTGEIGWVEAAELGAWCLVLERALQSVKERLREYVQRHGPVEVGGEEFGIYTRTSWECRDLPGLVAALEEVGEAAWSYLKVDSQKIKKLMQTTLGDAVREYVQEVQEPYFSHRAAEGETE